ncbi:MAG TPA: glycosyltransferase family 4 protein [Patescibacteria group bacterium]|nr:glycosyltransferase family 4 protein [Patescibacteria group bacterium]
MKIAFINKYQNKVSRGAETFVYELSRRLSKNHQVDVISNIKYLDFFKKRYDILIPTNGRLQVFIVRKIAWLTGAKVIVSGQSGMGWDDKLNLLSFPNTFVALTSKAALWAKNINPLVNIETIPNGVDLYKFTQKGKIIKTSLKSPIVLAVGAFTEQKRLDLAIKAVSKLKNFSLLIVGGGGNLRNNLEEMGNAMLGNKFQIISLPFDKMPEAYRVADVFTLPSASSEAFGNVLVEAMATNLPVVASDDPIRKEIVGDAGILVDPINTEKYAVALKKGLDTDWGSKPRKQAEKFSWDIIAKQYEELFEKLIKEK